MAILRVAGTAETRSLISLRYNVTGYYEATVQFLERQKKRKGHSRRPPRLDCHGPAALAFDKREGEHIGFALIISLPLPCFF
jgi:hypothetical protein